MARRKKARRGGSKGASNAKATPATQAEVTPSEAADAAEGPIAEAAQAEAEEAAEAPQSRPVGPSEEGNANAGLYVMAVVFGLIALAVVAASFME